MMAVLLPVKLKPAVKVVFVMGGVCLYWGMDPALLNVVITLFREQKSVTMEIKTIMMAVLLHVIHNLAV